MMQEGVATPVPAHRATIDSMQSAFTRAADQNSGCLSSFVACACYAADMQAEDGQRIKLLRRLEFVKLCMQLKQHRSSLLSGQSGQHVARGLPDLLQVS